LVSFLTEVPSFYNVEMPMDYPIIAPFYSDIDIRRTGQVDISPFYSDIDIRRTGHVDFQIAKDEYQKTDMKGQLSKTKH